jgi:hypothetical protein
MHDAPVTTIAPGAAAAVAGDASPGFLLGEGRGKEKRPRRPRDHRPGWAPLGAPGLSGRWSRGSQSAGWTRPDGTQDRPATEGGRVAPGACRRGRCGVRQQSGGMEGSGGVRRSARVAPPDPAGDAERRRTGPLVPPGRAIREAWRVCRRRRRRGSHCAGSGRGLSSREGRGGPVRGARPPPPRGNPATTPPPATSQDLGRILDPGIRHATVHPRLAGRRRTPTHPLATRTISQFISII